MICSRAEVLVYLRKADANISDADNALIDLVHPLAESAIHNYLQNALNYQIHTEYLPVGVADLPREYPLEDYQKQGDRFIYRGDESGTQSLKLSHTPVSLSGLRVWEDTNGYAGQGSSAFGDDTELTLGEDFFLDVHDSTNLSTSGLLYRIGAWPQEPRCVKVTYYGGHSAAALAGRAGGAIKLAALKQIAFEFNAVKTLNAKTGNSGPMIREKIGKYEYEMGESVALYVSGIAGSALLPVVKDYLQPYKSYKYL